MAGWRRRWDEEGAPEQDEVKEDAREGASNGESCSSGKMASEREGMPSKMD